MRFYDSAILFSVKGYPLIIDVLVSAPVKLTLEPMSRFTIYDNEIHPANQRFDTTVNDQFLVANVDAASLADAQLQIKARAGAMAVAFQQKRHQQFQDENASIVAAAMSVVAEWGCTLLYAPSPQRNDPSLILV